MTGEMRRTRHALAIAAIAAGTAAADHPLSEAVDDATDAVEED